MRTKRSRAILIGTVIAALLGLVVIPNAAMATTATVYVSPTAPSAPYNSCEHPAYSSIQAAVNAPDTVVHVCKGTYAEQLQIERSVKIVGYGASLKLPTPTANSTTPCDIASEEGSGLPDQEAISICGGKVTIENLAVEAIWPGKPISEAESCGYNLTGIQVAGGANLELSGSTVIGAAPEVINGCQYGLGILVGIPSSEALGAGTAKLIKDTVSGYQKNGITIAGKGATATITKDTVTGAGPIAALAQNGIGVQEGAKAVITSVVVSDNECEDTPACGEDALTQAQSDGVYFYEAGAGSSVAKSTILKNDVGVEAFDSPPVTPLISKNKIENSRDEAVQISQGGATVEGDTLANSNVGIQLLQATWQKYGPSGTGKKDTITGMKDWAVLGRSDNEPGDLFGEFTITKSKISGNPGPTPLKSVETENPTKLKIYAEKDH
jgi:hypothetical protein